MIKTLFILFIAPIFLFSYHPPQNENFNGPFAASLPLITKRKTFPLGFTILYSQTNFSYDKDWNRFRITKTESIHPYFSIYTGIFKWLSASISSGILQTKQQNNKAINWTDTALNTNIRLLKGGKYLPNATFSITEIVPSGKFSNLNKSKLSLDASGAGSYQTLLGLNFSKIIDLKKNAFKLIYNINYSFPSKVEVYGYNAYGGIDVDTQITRGIVTPGNVFSNIISIDISLTKKLDFSMDAIFAFSSKIKFSGRFGILTPGFRGSIVQNSPVIPIISSNIIPFQPLKPSLGAPEKTTAPSSSIISLTPTIGYAFSDNFTALATYWVSVAGRNASYFQCYALVISYVF
jgi:hypothetical protein